MSAPPNQMELMAVIDHSQRMAIISMITNDGAQNLEDVIDPQSPQYKWLMEYSNNQQGANPAKDEEK